MPSSVVAKGRDEVLGCAGSNYVPSATLATLNRLSKQQPDSIGVVGLPCQILALRKMQASRHDSSAKGVRLAIGLFCTWALSYKGFHELLKGRVDPLSVRRLDIPPPPANILALDTDAGRVEIPLQEVRPFIKPTCGICFDMTSEFADISVGMVEGVEGWNTLMARTPAGQELVEKAKKHRVIETKSLRS
jgi:coenzyme F420 hydrogenase subunit beta